MCGTSFSGLKEESHASQPFSSSSSKPPFQSQSRNTSHSWDFEQQQRIAKGLCFRCNECFAPGHHYKLASLTIMELDDVGNTVANIWNHVEDFVSEPDNDNPEEDSVAVLFHAILGNITNTTMKLKGTLCS